MMGCSTDITRLDLPARPRNARARRSLTLLLAGAMAAVASAQATDLIISQYLEGSSGNNKYLELYNGTASAINLTNYQLRLFTNGAGPVPSSSAVLSGSLPAGGTIVYGNSAGTFYLGPYTPPMEFAVSMVTML
ncbi:MAG: lamin tail domain-containing protein [Flavobacteriales bacterium]|nr:lamin tail domain-containing protein [Flavobacteriales bacterium]